MPSSSTRGSEICTVRYDIEYIIAVHAVFVYTRMNTVFLVGSASAEYSIHSSYNISWVFNFANLELFTVFRTYSANACSKIFSMKSLKTPMYMHV